MSRAKIAPTLRRFCSDDPGITVEILPDAQDELRALLAVARAAERLLRIGGCGRDVCMTGFDASCPAVIGAKRALARLRRASTRGEE